MKTQAQIQQQPFSQELEHWLKSSSNKSLGSLIKVFEEKAFAIIFLLLMALPALPLPTGGVTHVFEFIVALTCLQMIIGRATIWLPQRWAKVNVGRFMSGKAVGKLMSVIRWFEGWSRQRLSGVLKLRPVIAIIGLIILIFTVAAFVAPPFSGLDTLPALGVVIISLALILEDILILGLGFIVGCIGIGLELAAGTALYSGLTHLF